MPNEWRPLSKIIINNIEYQVTDQIVQELLEIIQENNGEVSLRLNNLNTRVNNNYSYIQTINNYLPSYTNVQIDWNETDNISNSYILNKPTFKTVNNESLIGSGNIVVSGLPQVSSSDNGKILMVVNGQWQLVSPSVLYSGNGIPNNNYGNNGDLFIQTD